jgi:hypothetical protein
MATDSELVPALILLLAACEKASEELDGADGLVHGLSEEIRVLSVRVRDSTNARGSAVRRHRLCTPRPLPGGRI